MLVHARFADGLAVSMHASRVDVRIDASTLVGIQEVEVGVSAWGDEPSVAEIPYIRLACLPDRRFALWDAPARPSCGCDLVFAAELC